MNPLNKNISRALIVTLVLGSIAIPQAFGQSVTSPEMIQFLAKENSRAAIVGALTNYRSSLSALDSDLDKTMQMLKEKNSYNGGVNLLRKTLAVANGLLTTLAILIGPSCPEGVLLITYSAQSILTVYDRKNYDSKKLLNDLSKIENATALMMQQKNLSDSEKAQASQLKKSVNDLKSIPESEVNSHTVRSMLSVAQLGMTAAGLVGGFVFSKFGKQGLPMNLSISGMQAGMGFGSLNIAVELLAGFKSSDRTHIMNKIAELRPEIASNIRILDSSIAAYSKQ